MPDGGEQRRVVPCGYDTDPGRFAANQAFRPSGADLPLGAVARRILALYHLPEQALALAEARGVLRPGGSFLACAGGG